MFITYRVPTHPIGTSVRRCFNVDRTFWRNNVVVETLKRRCVPAGERRMISLLQRLIYRKFEKPKSFLYAIEKRISEKLILDIEKNFIIDINFITLLTYVINLWVHLVQG